VEVGGTFSLDLHYNLEGHTVFGPVLEGMDVVDAIAAVAKDAGDKPLEDVVIESISFETVD
jgi:cyclophilin family peptidyl-prolyl cis-trans isomerase